MADARFVIPPRPADLETEASGDTAACVRVSRPLSVADAAEGAAKAVEGEQ